MVFCLQATEGLHCNTGPSGRDYRRLLENALGEQLYYCSHVDQIERNGTGRTKHTWLKTFDLCYFLSIDAMFQIVKGNKRLTKVLFTLLLKQEKCHQYWPAERSARYQYFVVDPMAEYNMPQYILREFKVTDARVRHT